MNRLRILRFFPLLIAGLLSSCETTPQSVIDRNQRILQEEPGDYYIGRRVAVLKTRFWGYVRRPRQMWEQAQLVVFNEREKLAPDRLPESPADGQRGFQYDNNTEYKLRGHFSGRQVYDPNSDKILPEFVLQDYQLITPSPGFLYHPREKHDLYGLPLPR